MSFHRDKIEINRDLLEQKKRPIFKAWMILHRIIAIGYLLLFTSLIIYIIVAESVNIALVQFLLRLFFILFGIISLTKTYLDIFSLTLEERRKSYLADWLEIIEVGLLLTFFFVSGGLYTESLFWIYFIIPVYTLCSQISMKTYLLFKGKHFLEIFTKKENITTVNQENMFPLITGILGIVSGILFLQWLWLIFHLLLWYVILNPKHHLKS